MANSINEIFSDIINSNKAYQNNFSFNSLSGLAVKELAIVTCIDSRIDPLAVVGMKSGDVKILRNAGARVTEDVLRTLVLASYLLNVKRILVMPHTDCAMATSEEVEIHERILDKYQVDTRSLEFRTVTNQKEALKMDITRIRSFPFLAKNVAVAGAIYNVTNGALELIDNSV
ncbi:MAG: beta-class carbonic anhydrase [Candidatus Nanopelagicales bacterium]